MTYRWPRKPFARSYIMMLQYASACLEISRVGLKRTLGSDAYVVIDLALQLGDLVKVAEFYPGRTKTPALYAITPAGRDKLLIYWAHHLAHEQTLERTTDAETKPTTEAA